MQIGIVGQGPSPRLPHPVPAPVRKKPPLLRFGIGRLLEGLEEVSRDSPPTRRRPLDSGLLHDVKVDDLGIQVALVRQTEHGAPQSIQVPDWQGVGKRQIVRIRVKVVVVRIERVELANDIIDLHEVA